MADKMQEAEKSGQEKAELGAKPAENKTETPADDPELDDLLDSALEDFDKPPPVSAPVAAAPVVPDVSPPQPQAGDPMAMFEQIFSAGGAEDGGDAQRQMAEAMRAMMGDDPELMQHLDQLAQAAGTADDSEESQRAFTGTLQDTLDSLSQNAQDMPSSMSEEDIIRAMSGLGLEDGGEGGDMDFMPMMQGMLKSLLSKEVLYPSLKEISTKYPDWLSEHKASLPADEYTNYEQQYAYMRQICEEFEQEADTDSESTKTQRFAKVMNLMQEMQNLGQPPKEIVGEMMPGVQFDDQGNPQLPGMGQQCSVM